jgi:hypothetical protein
MDDARRRQIANVLEQTLVDGERVVVGRQDGVVDVEPIEEANLRSLAEEKPELYGHMLAINENLSDAGSSMVVFPMLGVAGICLMIHMSWIDTFLGIEIEKLRSFWVYLFAVVAGFFLFGQIAVWLEAAAYSRQRGSLVEAVGRAGLNRWQLLARIAQDDDLSNVAEKLKTDSRSWGDEGMAR